MTAPASTPRANGFRTSASIAATRPTFSMASVERDGDHILLYALHENGTKDELYDLPISGIQTAEGVAFWVRHFAPKTWMTTNFLYLLACQIHALHEAP